MTTRDVFISKLSLGNILDELNLRAKQYHKGNGYSVEAAQKQALQDFAPYNKDGKYIPNKTIMSDVGDGQYFIAKE